MNPQSKPAIRTCILRLCLVLGLVAFATLQVQGQTFSVFYSFTGNGDGGYPLAGLVIDGSGNLYGTASWGGSITNCSTGCGTVFEIDSSGNDTTLYTFAGGTDGAIPEAQLLMDSQGNLYGTTYNGGGSANCSNGCGTVFKVATGGNETVLYRFNGGTDGANPVAGLTMDLAGNLYGTTFNGGAHGYGTVFRLNTSGEETVLYSFTGGADGANPIGGVTFDTKGRLYGTTSLGGDSTCANGYGTYGCGTVFRLMPSYAYVMRNGTALPWKESTLHTFEMQDDGGTPYAGLILDGSGNLYGAATSGGIGAGGTVFELTPSSGGWTFSVLYSLPGWTISGSFRNLVQDASGNIYATTHCDGANQAGTIYELTPSGSTWNYTSLYVFTGGSDGLYAFSNLVFDKQGNLYGTTWSGGGTFHGEVFKVTP